MNKYAYLSYHEKSTAHFLRIADTEAKAVELSFNGKTATTSHPENSGKPSDGKEPRKTETGWDYSHIAEYNIQSPEEGYAISKELGDLYVSLM